MMQFEEGNTVEYQVTISLNEATKYVITAATLEELTKIMNQIEQGYQNEDYLHTHPSANAK